MRTIEVVCTGVCPVKGKKSAMPIMVGISDGKLTEERWVWPVQAHVGSVYSAAVNDEGAVGNVTRNRLPFLRKWEDAAQVLAWEAESKATEALIRARNLAATQDAASPLAGLVAQLCEVYHRVPYSHRAAWLVWLNRELER